MAKKIGWYTKLDPELREAMRRYKDLVGVPEAQQVDRALREWLAQRPEAWSTSSKQDTTGKPKRRRKP
jgi:hypothetical protein